MGLISKWCLYLVFTGIFFLTFSVNRKPERGNYVNLLSFSDTQISKCAAYWGIDSKRLKRIKLEGPK